MFTRLVNSVWRSSAEPPAPPRKKTSAQKEVLERECAVAAKDVKARTLRVSESIRQVTNMVEFRRYSEPCLNILYDQAHDVAETLFEEYDALFAYLPEIRHETRHYHDLLKDRFDTMESAHARLQTASTIKKVEAAIREVGGLDEGVLV